MSSESVLALVFDADEWTSLVSFAPGIPVELGGMLELTFADGVDTAAQAGRTFHVFDWTGVTPAGAFTVDSDFLWDLSNLYTTGEMALVSALAGDTNGDGEVDLSDLNNVRNNFGLLGAPGMPGDAIPFDGLVDLDDLCAVRNNFGRAAGGAVPEPACLLLLLVGLPGVWLGLRRCGWADNV